jgi:hypothetical protein
MSIPLVPPKTDDGIWSREEVDLAGHRFLTWMHEVRHRGTFTKLATAFASMVQAFKRVETLRDLCLSWLEVSNTFRSLAQCDYADPTSTNFRPYVTRLCRQLGDLPPSLTPYCRSSPRTRISLIEG